MRTLPNAYFVTLLAVTGMISLFNSCKKDDQASFRDNLTRDTWQLASLQVTTFQRYQPSVTDTLSVYCGKTLQSLKFDADGAARYSNFQCNGTSVSGNWSYNADQLLLNINIPLKDTLNKTNPNPPFAASQLVTLGRNTLIFRIGDLNSYYADNAKHRVYRYSFIHQSL